MAPIKLTVDFISHITEVHIAPTSRGQKLENAIVRYLNFPYPNVLRILVDGSRFIMEETLEEQRIGDGQRVDIMMQHGAAESPGLRIASPRDIDRVSLVIALARGTSAENVRIPGRGFPQGDQRVLEWSGLLHAQGPTIPYFEHRSLQDRETGDTGRAITWDVSLDDSAPNDVSPLKLYCNLNDTNAVVLRYDEVASYINNLFEPLSFNREGPESLLTHYYQQLVRSRFVAIRFLEQSIYQHIAPLGILPPPDVVTRVVLLYQNVHEHDLDAWTKARKRAQLGPSYWTAVAGYDKRAEDVNLYRALEWRAINIPA
ncbi:hypothetical protein PENSPDRAFT_164529 [Peniophora sp. CONT]|nr:hypothetical protein PENSPDRAFT_164529 [Peniophora sp. CONT]